MNKEEYIDNNGVRGAVHKPCKKRRYEYNHGVMMDMCYAIGFERVGDMPCEYCNEHRDEYKKND